MPLCPSSRRRRLAWKSACLIALGFAGTSAGAAYADTDVAAPHYLVKSWTAKDVFVFGDTSALAQGKDGYLWLGTRFGLVRFDGVDFTLWNVEGLPKNSAVTAICSARDGTLWIGRGGPSGILRLRGGEVTQYASQDGLPDSYVVTIAEDRDGTIWASTNRGVLRFGNGQWQRMDGLLSEPSRGLFVDRGGSVWVGGASGLIRTGKMTRQVELVTSSSEIPGIAEDSYGRLWVTDPIHTVQGIAESGLLSDRPRLDMGAGVRLLTDRHQNLWVGTAGQGLLRFRPTPSGRGPVVERFTTKDGLPSNTVRALLEDREGNIWVATQGGLSRLSERTVITLLEGAAISAITTAPDKSLWAATGDGLYRIVRGIEQRFTIKAGLPSNLTSAVHVDKTNTLWVATRRGLARFEGGRFAAPVFADTPRLNHVRTLTSNSPGGMWLYDIDLGFLRMVNGQFRAVAPPLHSAGVIFCDTSGRVWLGLEKGTVGVFQNDRLQMFAEKDGITGGTVTAIFEDSRGVIWIGTTQGLSQFKDGRFAAFENDNHLATGIAAILEDLSGHLWLATGTSVLRVSLDDLARSGTRSFGSVRRHAYDATDGLPGLPVGIGWPNAVRDADGTLWFVTTNGLAGVDPRRIRGSEAARTVNIEAVVFDGREAAPRPGLALPPHTAHLQVRYSTPSLTSPAKTHFRYMLEGFDKSWVSAGSRREAIYTNLKAGNYRFRVVAATLADASAGESTWNFVVGAAFYETTWFLVGCGGLLVISLGIAVQLRILSVRRRLLVVFAERTRIARELHDTLLQGLVGIGFQFDGISQQLTSSPDIALKRMAALREHVQQYVKETRWAIWALRSPIAAEHDLPVLLERMMARLLSDTAISLTFAATGTRRTLTESIQHQVLRITHEAIMNVVRHARATTLNVLLDYQPSSIRLRISDDGVGFAPSQDMNAGQETWGLRTMRERAEEINASFSIRTNAGIGTEITLVVPM